MEPHPEHKSHYDNYRKKGLLGVIIIFAGLALLLFNTGIFPEYFRHIIFSWPMLLLIIGIVSLIGSENRIPGVILMLIGGFFLMPRVFDFNISFTHLFWPLILICLGILILVRRFPHPGHWKQRLANSPNAGAALDQGYVFEDHIFSGTEKRIISKEFRGGEDQRDLRGYQA